MYPYHERPEFQCFRPVPKTGVIFVMSEASEQGFYYGNPDWANLGQGAPETGPLPGSPARLESIEMPQSTYEYSPVAGMQELREAVAALYNARFREGKSSKYTAENVAISPGGRSGLTRIAAGVDHVNLGHFLPDYTAYEELLDLFREFIPIPLILKPEFGFRPEPDLIEEQIMGMGLAAILLSNPCNPTGQLLERRALERWVKAARDLQCALIMDEFYSHYLYAHHPKGGPALSSAAFVDDVDKDPVLILDGLTKNWRYPGLRLSWTVGPKELIHRVTSAGSFLDGGAPHAIQRAAIPLLDPEVANAEARAIQEHFGAKRFTMIERLQKMGFILKSPPEGSFYCFPSLEHLPEPLRDGMNFFREALKHKVICVPGEFFDVNPGKRRSHIPSRLKNYVRLSFGPSMEEVSKGLDRFEAMIDSFS